MMTCSSTTVAAKLGESRLMVSFSAERIVCLVARSALITMILLSFPLLHSVIFSRSGVDNSLELQMLLTDLRHSGLFNSDDHAVFLGNSLSLLPLLKKNNLIPLSLQNGSSLLPIIQLISSSQLMVLVMIHLAS
jgi:hypothetical protein